MSVTRLDTDLGPYLTDASNLAGGHADAVLMPETEEEVAEILRNCAAEGTPVTVSGAGTGLAGGRVPYGGILLSLARMNRIIAIDAGAHQAMVEPGVILYNLENELTERGLLYPPDPTERGGQIGGNISTNASGARTFKYGATRRWVDELHVVLSTGERLHLVRGEHKASGRTLILQTEEGSRIDVPIPGYTMPNTSKHAAGYYAAPDMDAVDLFVGSEGTLGVVTRAVLRLTDLPGSLFSGIVFFADEESTLRFVEDVRDRSRAQKSRGGSDLEARALEFIDANALEVVREAYPDIPAEPKGGAVWFEQEIGDGDGEEERLIGLWAEVIGAFTPLVDDSWFALTERDQQRMRDFRHAVPSTTFELISRHHMRKFGTDMAVPDDRFPEMLHYYRARLAESDIVNLTWGHIGNSHLHVNLLPEREEQIAEAQQMYDDFVERALSLGGTVSAEHGVGKFKGKYLRTMFGDRAIDEMKAVRRALDPAGIMGRGTMTA